RGQRRADRARAGRPGQGRGATAGEEEIEPLALALVEVRRCQVRWPVNESAIAPVWQSSQRGRCRSSDCIAQSAARILRLLISGNRTGGATEPFYAEPNQPALLFLISLVFCRCYSSGRASAIAGVWSRSRVARPLH